MDWGRLSVRVLDSRSLCIASLDAAERVRYFSKNGARRLSGQAQRAVTESMRNGRSVRA